MLKTVLVGFAAATVFFTAGASLAQQMPQKPDPVAIQMQLEETQFLLVRRRDQVAQAERAIEEMDTRLKWVLDNWVAK